MAFLVLISVLVGGGGRRAAFLAARRDLLWCLRWEGCLLGGGCIAFRTAWELFVGLDNARLLLRACFLARCLSCLRRLARFLAFFFAFRALRLALLRFFLARFLLRWRFALRF